MILLDTNILARTIQAGHVHQKPALDAIQHLYRDGHEAFSISPQVLVEFYHVATRSTNALVLTPAQAITEISKIKSNFMLLPELPDMFPAWESLVGKYAPTNRTVYDLRHVAFMLVHRIPKLLAFNDKDFVHCNEIQTLNPFDVLQLPRV